MRKNDDTDGSAVRKGKPKQKSLEYDAPFVGYVNVQLTAAQKESFEAWCESASLWDTLDFSVRDGVHLSCRYEYKSDAFLSSATQRRSTSPNAGLCVTARASSPWLSYARLLFILAYLGTAERWEDLQPRADPDRW